MHGALDMQPLSVPLPAHLRGSTGPQPRKLVTSFVRALNRADIIFLLSAPTAHRPRPLQEIRQRHHRLARLLAMGVRVVEISAQTGYSPNRISMLQKDPSFRNLVAFYEKAVGEAYADVLELAGDVGVAALTELQNRLESEPESFTNMELAKAAIALMDRTGHGPTRTVQVTNTADVIRSLKERRDAEQDFVVLSPEEDSE